MRKFTQAERAALTLAAARVRDEVDGEAGQLLLRIASGDESPAVYAALHDRLNVAGRHDQADRLRALLGR